MSWENWNCVYFYEIEHNENGMCFTNYCLETFKGKNWHTRAGGNYYFQDKADETMFRLRWC